MTPRPAPQIVYRLTPASKDRCDVEPMAKLVCLRTDADVLRLTPTEARSLAVYLQHAADDAERTSPP